MSTRLSTTAFRSPSSLTDALPTKPAPGIDRTGEPGRGSTWSSAFANPDIIVPASLPRHHRLDGADNPLDRATGIDRSGDVPDINLSRLTDILHPLLTETVFAALIACKDTGQGPEFYIPTAVLDTPARPDVHWCSLIVSAPDTVTGATGHLVLTTAGVAVHANMHAAELRGVARLAETLAVDDNGDQTATPAEIIGTLDNVLHSVSTDPESAGWWYLCREVDDRRLLHITLP